MVLPRSSDRGWTGVERSDADVIGWARPAARLSGRGPALSTLAVRPASGSAVLLVLSVTMVIARSTLRCCQSFRGPCVPVGAEVVHDVGVAALRSVRNTLTTLIVRVIVTVLTSR